MLREFFAPTTIMHGFPLSTRVTGEINYRDHLFIEIVKS